MGNRGQDPVSEGELVLHYEIQSRLGAGGMGVVFRALDRKLQRAVALKFLPSANFEDDKSRERLLREAMAASALDHPNVGAVHSIEEAPDGRLFIVMPCYVGETVRQYIDRGPLPSAQAVELVLQCARGLAKAHDKGVIHRDIKPSNLIVTSEGVLKIVDFGLVKFSDQTSLTKTGTAMGTAAYMSPEQVRGLTVDHRTDIWSLGATLYEMLAGQPPFLAENIAAMLYAVAHEQPAPLPWVPLHIQRIALKCLAKAPNERYQSMAELIQALEQSQSGNSAVVSTLTLTAPPVDGAGRRPIIWSAAAAGCLLVAGFVWLSLNGGRPSPPGQSPVTVPAEAGRQKQTSTSSPANSPTKSDVSGRKEPPPPTESKSKSQASARPTPSTVKKKPAVVQANNSEGQVYSGPKEGRLNWTGELGLEPGQSIDLTAAGGAGTVSGSLPGVPVTIEIHPASVHVITAPAASNQWRRLVVKNDGKKVFVVLVNWTVIRP